MSIEKWFSLALVIVFSVVGYPKVEASATNLVTDWNTQVVERETFNIAKALQYEILMQEFEPVRKCTPTRDGFMELPSYKIPNGLSGWCEHLGRDSHDEERYRIRVTGRGVTVELDTETKIAVVR